MGTAFLLGVNPFLDAYLQSDFFGKGIFLALLALSLLSWALLVHKVKSERLMRRSAQDFYDAFQKKRHHPLSLDCATNQDANPFLEIYRSLKSYTLELLQKNKASQQEGQESVYLSPADIELVGSQLLATVANQVKTLEKNLFILSTTVTLAPFLGLLGTVWGILTSLSQLGARASGQTNEFILGGLAMALGTTVIGLLVAIPALIANSYLKNKVREFQTDMEQFSTLALATVEVQYRKV